MGSLVKILDENGERERLWSSGLEGKTADRLEPCELDGDPAENEAAGNVDPAHRGQENS